MKLLQVDFKMEGPWGDEMSKAFSGLAADIAGEKGLIWKIWTENRETGEGGGIYLFETGQDAERYIEMHTVRLKGFGIDSVNAKIFDVNVPLTEISRGKLF